MGYPGRYEAKVLLVDTSMVSPVGDPAGNVQLILKLVLVMLDGDKSLTRGVHSRVRPLAGKYDVLAPTAQVALLALAGISATQLVPAIPPRALVVLVLVAFQFRKSELDEPIPTWVVPEPVPTVLEPYTT